MYVSIYVCVYIFSLWMLVLIILYPLYYSIVISINLGRRGCLVILSLFVDMYISSLKTSQINQCKLEALVIIHLLLTDVIKLGSPLTHVGIAKKES